MAKILCPFCESQVVQNTISFPAVETDLEGKEIVVPDVKINQCTNSKCSHEWLPTSEEEKISAYITRHSRFYLDQEQVGAIREALGFATKTAAANFLTLNSKAFTKWENGYTNPNTSSDLLMRLAVFSEANFNFIKALQAKKFAFDPNDYELLCKSTRQNWNFNTHPTFQSVDEQKFSSSEKTTVSGASIVSDIKLAQTDSPAYSKPKLVPKSGVQVA